MLLIVKHVVVDKKSFIVVNIKIHSYGPGKEIVHCWGLQT